MCCKFAATVLTAIFVPRWVKYCSDLKVLNKCFMLVGAEQHSDLLKVNIHIISIYFHDILLLIMSHDFSSLTLRLWDSWDSETLHQHDWCNSCRCWCVFLRPLLQWWPQPPGRVVEGDGLDWWRDINKFKYSEVCVYQMLNRPGVVGAVLQTPL